MPYLTKILLGPAALRKENIRDDYSIHRLIYSLFPRQHDTASGRFLYADKGAIQGGRLLLVLSAAEPVMPDGISASTVIISERFWGFTDYRFEVELNPVRKEKADGKRHAVTGQLELLKWFLEHAAGWGFSADTGTLEVQIRQTRCIPKNGTDAVFNRAVFRGKLHVENKEIFRQSCVNGLGHGKAFGFGLLQLTPIQTKKTDNN